ncbi:MAG: CotH kinase family protein, partial [Candidatus Pacearchaeota archaeon]|nr:CotH kinase family protein [Candidatus Pacearchaeota archaeon]
SLRSLHIRKGNGMLFSRSILWLLTFGVAGVFAAGENNYGFVHDKETDLPLSGVTVKSLTSGNSHITDSTGRFVIAKADIRLNRPEFVRSRYLYWNPRAHSIDISGIPDLRMLELLTTGGRRLASCKPVAGQERVELPEMSPGVYLLRGSLRNHTFVVKVIQAHGNQSERVHIIVHQSHRQANAPATTDTLVFSKNLFQTKKVVFHSDSTYDGVTVNLAHAIGDFVFMDTVRSYHLTIGDDAMARLLDYASLSPGPGEVNAEYVPADLRYENRELDSIAIRFRGDQSLWDCITDGQRNVGIRYPQFGFGNDDVCAKFSFKFNFKKYKNEHRLFGLKKLNLRSMAYDPTKMHERLGFSFFHDMGIVSPRTTFARLYVNGDYWGLFCAVEEIDGRMTKHRFPESGDGNLYKDLWPDDYASDWKVVEALRTNEEEEDVADFIAFRDLVTASSTTESNFVETVGEQVDIPYLVNYMVVDRAITNFDGIVALYAGNGYRMRHNYCWYRDLPSTKFILIPWDLDKALLYPEPNFWTNNQSAAANPVPNWNVITEDYTPIGCYFDPSTIAMDYLGDGPYYDVAPIDSDVFLRLFRSTTWDDFVSTGHRFLDEVFLQDTVDARLNTWRLQIASAVGEDETIDSTAWETMVDSLSNTIPLLRAHFEQMLDTLIDLRMDSN